jgi:hypothetical protein
MTLFKKTILKTIKNNSNEELKTKIITVIQTDK